MECHPIAPDSRLIPLSAPCYKSLIRPEICGKIVKVAFCRKPREALVTQRILKDGVKVGYLYRDEPDNENDSGWRFTANEESEEYMDDPENSVFVSVGLVLSKDDSFIDLLDAPVGASFAKDVTTQAFVPLVD